MECSIFCHFWMNSINVVQLTGWNKEVKLFEFDCYNQSAIVRLTEWCCFRCSRCSKGCLCVCLCAWGGECCHPDRMQVSVNRRELMHDEFPHNSVGAVYRIQLILYFSYKSFSNLNSNFKRVTSELSSRASHCHFK